MIDIKKSRYSKYFLFSSLYFIQGLILTISWVIIPLYFIKFEISLPVTSLVIGIGMLPWSIKFFWGGIVDYFIEHGRKKFILMGGLLFAFGLFSLTFIDPKEYLALFTIFLFLSVNGIVFLDVAIDAWAIQTSEEEDRGKISGSMFAGQNSGYVVTIILFTYIGFNFGYNYVFLIAALIAIIISLFPILFEEKKITRKDQKIKQILIGEFKKKKTQIISLFTSLLFISSGIIIVAIPMFLSIQLKLDDPFIGVIIATATTAQAIGCIIGGYTSDKYGRKKMLNLYISISIIFILLIVFAKTWLLLLVILSIYKFLYGGYTTINLALLMDTTNPKIGALQFSILASLANSGLTGGNAVSGSFVTLLGFTRTFIMCAWFLGPPLLILYFINLKNNIKNG
ncbi:MAG: MFS transporter [Thermoplasmatales archaeon]|nr:MAG: MFS transporter [Thermoplasmatales archaeon]